MSEPIILTAEEVEDIRVTNESFPIDACDIADLVVSHEELRRQLDEAENRDDIDGG